MTTNEDVDGPEHLPEGVRLARVLLEALGRGSPPEEISRLFSEDASVEVPGDIGALPWIGLHSGRAAADDFIRGTRERTPLVSLEVEDIVGNATRGVIVARLHSTVLETGREIQSPVVMVLTVTGGTIQRLLFLEDSFQVSCAARGSRNAEAPPA